MPNNKPTKKRPSGITWLAFMAGVTTTSIAMTAFLLLSAPHTTTDKTELATTALTTVEFRKLHDIKNISGTLRTNKTIPGLPEGHLVTSLTETPVPLGAATPIAELNGEPLFLLPTNIGMWRDLTPGAVGKDVYALQKYLRQTGHRTTKPTSTYDRATAQQLTKLLTKQGYKHLTKPPADEQPAPHSDTPQTTNSTNQAPPPWIMPCKKDWFLGVSPPIKEVTAGNLTLGTRITPENHLTASGANTTFVVADGGTTAREITRHTSAQQLELQLSNTTAIPITSVNATEEHSEFVITPDKNHTELPQGVTTAQIVLASTPTQVLAVPQRAIRSDEQLGTHVLKVDPTTESGSTPVPVTTGFVGQEWVEVTNTDLSTADQLILP